MATMRKLQGMRRKNGMFNGSFKDKLAADADNLSETAPEKSFPLEGPPPPKLTTSKTFRSKNILTGEKRRDVVIPNQSGDEVETETDELALRTDPFWRRRRRNTRLESFPEIENDVMETVKGVEDALIYPEDDEHLNKIINNPRHVKGGVRDRNIARKKKLATPTRRKGIPRGHKNQLHRNSDDPPPPRAIKGGVSQKKASLKKASKKQSEPVENKHYTRLGAIGKTVSLRSKYLKADNPSYKKHLNSDEIATDKRISKDI